MGPKPQQVNIRNTDINQNGSINKVKISSQSIISGLRSQKTKKIIEDNEDNGQDVSMDLRRASLEKRMLNMESH